MDFWRVLDILGKRKWLIVLSMVVTVCLTFLATRLTGARWDATIQFVAATTGHDKKANSDSGGDDDQGPRQAKTEAKIYSSLLHSRDVLEPALRKLNLSELPPNMLNDITFEAVGPRMFEMHVFDTNPRRATEVANTLAAEFVEKNSALFAQREADAVRALDDQYREATEKLNATRSTYDRYRKMHHVVANLNDQLTPAILRLNQARQQRDEVLQRLADAKTQLESRKHQLIEMPKTAQVRANANNSPLVKQLEEEQARLEGQLVTLRVKYTDEKIEVKQALATLNAVRARLEAERKKPATSEPTIELMALKRSINDLKVEVASYEAQRQVVEKNLQSAQDAVEGYTGVDGPLATLTSQMAMETEARANIAARLQAAQVALDAAKRQDPIAMVGPVSDFNPPINTTAGRTTRLLLIGALCALFGTCAIIIALDTIDRRIRTVGEAQRVLPVPVVAAIPLPAGGVTPAALPRVAEFYPQSLHAEAYHFLGLRLLQQEGDIRSLVAVSAKADQGSTSTVTNLGIALAQTGARVVVVDANIRTPQVHNVFGLDNDYGLTTLLTAPNSFDLQRVLQPSGVPNLQILTSGPSVDNPWEMFRSSTLTELVANLRETVDFVLYDTPSALAFADAMSLARVVDGAFLCVRALEPLSGAEATVTQMLSETGVVMLGGVLSDVPASVLDSYPSYRHYYPTDGSNPPALAPPGDSGDAPQRPGLVAPYSNPGWVTMNEGQTPTTRPSA